MNFSKRFLTDLIVYINHKKITFYHLESFAIYKEGQYKITCNNKYTHKKVNTHTHAHTSCIIIALNHEHDTATEQR